MVLNITKGWGAMDREHTLSHKLLETLEFINISQSLYNNTAKVNLTLRAFAKDDPKLGIISPTLLQLPQLIPILVFFKKLWQKFMDKSFVETVLVFLFPFSFEARSLEFKHT